MTERFEVDPTEVRMMQKNERSDDSEVVEEAIILADPHALRAGIAAAVEAKDWDKATELNSKLYRITE